MGVVSAVLPMHCPSCGASDVRESHTHGPVDALLAIFGLVAYRCRACRGRFHKRPPPEDFEDDLEDQDAAAEDKHSDKDSR
jgi:hypothetical protein